MKTPTRAAEAVGHSSHWGILLAQARAEVMSSAEMPPVSANSFRLPEGRTDVAPACQPDLGDLLGRAV